MAIEHGQHARRHFPVAAGDRNGRSITVGRRPCYAPPEAIGAGVAIADPAKFAKCMEYLRMKVKYLFGEQRNIESLIDALLGQAEVADLTHAKAYCG